MREPATRLSAPKPPSRPDEGSDPLGALLRKAIDDPDTDGHVRQWLRQLVAENHVAEAKEPVLLGEVLDGETLPGIIARQHPDAEGSS